MVSALLSASPDCIKLLTPQGRLVFMNFGGMCQMDIADFESVKDRLWWSLWPEPEQPQLERAVAMAARGQVQRLIAPCATAAGTPKWWDVSVSPVFDTLGSVDQILVVSRDVTGVIDRTARLEAALSAADLLRKEVDHRVKNSLSMVSAMLRLQARRSDAAVAEALGMAAARVQTIGKVHDMLHVLPAQGSIDGDVDLGPYLTHLCEDLGAALLEAGDVSVHFDIEPVTLSVKTVRALGLCVNELLTNAIRHGELDAGDSLSVRVEREADGVRMVVADTGVGLPEGFDLAANRGIGMQVVRLMVDQIGGELTFDSAPKQGSRFVVQFPHA